MITTYGTWKDALNPDAIQGYYENFPEPKFGDILLQPEQDAVRKSGRVARWWKNFRGIEDVGVGL